MGSIVSYDSISGMAPATSFLELEGPLSSDDTNKITPIQLGAMFWKTLTEDDEVVAGDMVLLDPETTDSFTATLPAAPLIGQQIYLYLASKSTAGRYVDIAPNGKNINGSSANIRLTIQDWYLWLRYDGTEWKIIVDGRSTLIFDQDASSVSSVVIEDDFSPFSHLELVVTNYQPSTNGAYLYLRFSDDLGSTYDSGSNYAWHAFKHGASGAYLGGTNQAQISLLNDTYSTTPRGNGRYVIHDPASSGRTSVSGQVTRLDSSAASWCEQMGGRAQNIGVTNGLQLIPNTGTISLARITVNGILA